MARQRPLLAFLCLSLRRLSSTFSSIALLVCNSAHAIPTACCTCLLHMPAAHACCTCLLHIPAAAHACCTCLLLTPVVHWQVRSSRSIGALTSPSTWRCVAPHPAHIRTLPSPPRPPPAGAKPPAGLQVAGAKGKVRLWDSLSALAVRRRFEGLAPALAARKGRRLPTTVAGMD